MLLGMGGGSARQSRVVSGLSARAFISMSCFCRFLLLVCYYLKYLLINQQVGRNLCFVQYFDGDFISDSKK